MASATTRPSFTFMITQPPPSPKPPKHHHHLITFPPLLPKKNLSISALNTHSSSKLLHPTRAKSIDVSKEDKPPSSEPLVEEETSSSSSEAAAAENEASGQEQEDKFDKRRLEEKFAVLNTGIYECRSCGYKYDEAVGDPSYPIPPGLPFDRLPDDWRCLTCGASKSFFQSKSVEIAGFAQNQQFGLGGNALTAGQKAVLIYGGLFLGFLFFLSGYFLQ